MKRNVTRRVIAPYALAIAALLGSVQPTLAQTEDLPKTADAAPVTAEGGGDGGEEAYNNACRTCHSVKAGDNRLGPSLSGIVGKKSGSEPGYAYSPSLKDAAVTFDEKTLDSFISNPDGVVPGNNMKPYTGISDAALRAKIIAFLKTAN